MNASPSKDSIKPINFSSAYIFVFIKNRVNKIDINLRNILIEFGMFILNRYINKVLIFGLIIIVFYNIFSMFILVFNHKIEGSFSKIFNYLPYKHSAYFQKPLRYSKKILQTNNDESKKFFSILISTENKSALDYSYWNNKLLYKVSKNYNFKNFEKDFQNAVILSKNNLTLKKTLKLFYLRNILLFNNETKNLILSN